MARFIKHAVYSHDLDKDFETTCPHHCDSHEKVCGIKDWIREEVVKSNRFTTQARLDAEAQRYFELAVLIDLKFKMNTPTDYLGIDPPSQTPAIPETTANPPAWVRGHSNIELV